jgi:CelD/BcsL family acetyltransferase involved in cellulose biosynthesis
LLSFAQADGYLTGHWEISPAPYIKLPGREEPPEEALRRLSSNLRKSVRRRRRKLEEKGEILFTRVTEAKPSELERFYQLERSGWKGKKGTAIACDTRTRRFYDEVARRAAEFGYLSLYALEFGGRAIAMQLCLIYGGRGFAIKPAYDESFSAYAPGNLLGYEIALDMAAQGLTEYDLLSPQTESKSEWTKDARAESWLYIFRPSLAGGALYFWKFRLMSFARQLKRNLLSARTATR